ncbi:hypothetical protein HDU99_000001 [Rhizoclosmatium hyalinum]|nr:hypothetical protein HDU99_000001 [Rhizoclosmatium hyalinum]
MSLCFRSDSGVTLNEAATFDGTTTTSTTTTSTVTSKAGTRVPETVIAPTERVLRFNNSTVATVFQVSAHRPGRTLFRDLEFVFPHYSEHCVAKGLTALPPQSQSQSLSLAQSNNSFSEVQRDNARPNVQRLLSNMDIRRQAPQMTPDNLIVVQTFQRSNSDLMVINDESNNERNLLLETFSAWGRYVISRIRAQGFWADMTDPCSGYPVYTPRGTSLYPDVDGAARLLKYNTHLVGCCRIISHPVWGTRNYPATLFTTCPVDLLAVVLEDSYQSHHSF